MRSIAVVSFSLVWLLLATHPVPAAAQGPDQQSAGEEDLRSRRLEGVMCSEPIKHDPEGRLVSCVLAREHRFGSIVLPARTWVLLRDDGRPWSAELRVGEPVVLDGHRCRGGRAGWPVTFHDNDRLASCYLAETETIDGVWCRRGSYLGEKTGDLALGIDDNVVRFHDNGRLRTCRLAADLWIRGRSYASGDRITLDREGNPVSPEGEGDTPPEAGENSDP